MAPGASQSYRPDCCLCFCKNSVCHTAISYFYPISIHNKKQVKDPADLLYRTVSHCSNYSGTFHTFFYAQIPGQRCFNYSGTCLNAPIIPFMLPQTIWLWVALCYEGRIVTGFWRWISGYHHGLLRVIQTGSFTRAVRPIWHGMPRVMQAGSLLHVQIKKIY